MNVEQVIQDYLPNIFHMSLATAVNNQPWVREVRALFAERLGTAPSAIADAATLTGHKFYKITVSEWFVFDARESSPSQKYSWSK